MEHTNTTDEQVDILVDKITKLIEKNNSSPSQSDFDRLENALCGLREDVREDIQSLRSEFRGDITRLHKSVQETRTELSVWQGRIGVILVAIGALVGSAASVAIDWLVT